MFGAVELKRDSLVDRHGDSFGRGIAIVAGVNRNGLSLHSLTNQTVVTPRRMRISPISVYFELAATLRTGMVALSRDADFASARVTVRAAKPAPNANRITGPKLFAAATPAK